LLQQTGKSKQLKKIIQEFVELDVDLKKKNQEVPQSLVLVITYFPRVGDPQYKDPKFEVYDEITGETKPVVPANPDVHFNSSVHTGVYDPMKVLVLAMTNGCQVIIENIFFDVNVPGEFNLYLAQLATLDENGEINDECYRKGYASSALSEFLDISDRYGIEVDLTAASQDKQKFPNRKLVDFYNAHGFQHYGNPNNGTVEMSRPRKKD
jgi:hypothetical protein